jgi:hypothetical protein
MYLQHSYFETLVCNKTVLGDRTLRRLIGWWGGALTVGLVPLSEESWQSFFSLPLISILWIQLGGGHLWTRNSTFTQSPLCWHPDFGFHAFTVRDRHLLFKVPRLWYSVMATQTKALQLYSKYWTQVVPVLQFCCLLKYWLSNLKSFASPCAL